MKALSLFVFIGFSQIMFSQGLDRCPEEWHGTISFEGKTKSEIYTAALAWTIINIEMKAEYKTDENVGAIKAQKNIPYHSGYYSNLNIERNVSKKAYIFKCDIGFIAKDNELNYSRQLFYERKTIKLLVKKIWPRR